MENLKQYITTQKYLNTRHGTIRLRPEVQKRINSHINSRFKELEEPLNAEKARKLLRIERNKTPGFHKSHHNPYIAMRYGNDEPQHLTKADQEYLK